MLAWPQIILLLLQLAKAFMGEREAARNYKAGEDAQIAKEALAILERTEAGRRLLEQINAMSDAGVDDLIDELAGLKPGGGGTG